MVIGFIVLAMAAGGAVAQSNLEKNTAIDAGKTVSGNFAQNRHLIGFDAPLRTSGAFFLVPELGLAWIVKKPFNSRLIMTDEGITQITHGTVMKVDSGGIGKIIAGMMYPALVGDWPKLEQDFDVQQKRALTGEGLWQITLLPRNDQMKNIISKIVVKGHVVTHSLLIVKTSGDQDEITFSDQKTWNETPVIATNAFTVTLDK